MGTPSPHRLSSTIVREDEHLLVAAARAGDAAAFEELVNRYEDKIFRLERNITGNHEDAEDAMQDAFLKAYAHLQDFHGDSRFYTWLVRIAANEALMRLRKRRPNQVSLHEPIEGDNDLMPRELEGWGPTPERKYAQTEIRSIVGELIDRLEPEYRIVFLLRDFEELSTQETAERWVSPYRRSNQDCCGHALCSGKNCIAISVKEHQIELQRCHPRAVELHRRRP